MTANEWGMIFTAAGFWSLWLRERHTHRRTQRDLEMALMLECSERVRRQGAERALALAPALPAPPLEVTQIVF